MHDQETEMSHWLFVEEFKDKYIFFKTTNIRFDATVISGYPEPYYKGGAELDKYGCEGCYQFDPVEYRKTFYSKKD